MTTTRWLGIFLSTSVLLLGCSNKLPPLPTADGQAKDTTVDSGGGSDLPSVVDGGGPSDVAPPVSPCPSQMPAFDEPCTQPVALICEYGDDPRPFCHTRASCVNGVWVVSVTGCPPPPDVDCPNSRDAAADQPCPVDEAFCSYDGLVCQCSYCTLGGPASQCGTELLWRCDAPNPDPLCPPAPPTLGSLCDQDALFCSYKCGPGNARECVGGVWYEADGGPCPVSTRRAKKGIRYLNRGALEKLARQTLEMRLATYRYKNPINGHGPQLGFIIEDVGESFATDTSRGRVNLYGYTSMLLATVKSQQRAIEELRREVKALRRTMRAEKGR